MTDKPEALFAVNLSRTIDSPPEPIFRAFTDPERYRRWFPTKQLIMQPVVNGLYFLEVEHASRLWAHYGRYLEVTPARLLKFTWMSEATHGKETVVTVELVPEGQGKKTVLRLSHTGIPDSEIGRSHLGGWTQITEAIAKSTESGSHSGA